MTGPLDQRLIATTRTSAHPLHARPLIRHQRRDVEVLPIHLEIHFSVGYCRFNQLIQKLRTLVRHVLKHSQGLVGIHTAHLVADQAQLLR